MKYMRNAPLPGDFVFLIQYWDNLIWPIEILSTNYHYLMSDIIDAERLLDLLMIKPGVVDKEGASSIGPVEGKVEFENVNFTMTSKDLQSGMLISLLLPERRSHWLASPGLASPRL